MSFLTNPILIVYYQKPTVINIFFPNPNQTLMWGWPGGIVREQNQVNSGIVSMKPLKNLLYIFPSWANHSVDANESDEPRISLSFNTGLIQ